MRLFSGSVKLFLYGDYDTSYYSRLQGRVTNLHMELSNGKGDRIVFPLPEGKDLRRNEFERLFSSFAPYGFIFDMELVEELLAHTEKQISYRDLEGSSIPFSYKQIIKCGTAREGEGKEDDDAIADAIPTLMDLIWHGGVLGVDCAKLGGTDATEDIKRECLASYKAFVRFLSPQHFEDKWFQKMAEAQMARIDKAWAFLSSNFDFLTVGFSISTLFQLGNWMRIGTKIGTRLSRTTRTWSVSGILIIIRGIRRCGRLPKRN